MQLKNSLDEVKIKPKIDVVWFSKEVLKRKGEIVVGDDGVKVEIGRGFLMYLVGQDERLVEFVGIDVEDVRNFKSQLNFVVLNMDLKVRYFGKLIWIVEAFLIYLSVENRSFLYNQRCFNFDEFLRKNSELGLTFFNLVGCEVEVVEMKNPYNSKEGFGVSERDLEVVNGVYGRGLVANVGSRFVKNGEELSCEKLNEFIDMGSGNEEFCDVGIESGRKSLVLNNVSLNVGSLEVNYLVEKKEDWMRMPNLVFGVGFIGMGVILLIAVRNEFLSRYFEVLESNTKVVEKSDRSLEKKMEDYRYNSGLWFMNLAKSEQLVLSDFKEIVEMQNNLSLPFRAFDVSQNVSDGFYDYGFGKVLKFDDVEFEDEFKKKSGFIGLIPVDRKRQIGKIFEFEKLELMFLGNSGGESKGVLMKSLNGSKVQRILENCHENGAKGCLVWDGGNSKFRMSNRNWSETRINAFLSFGCDRKNVNYLAWGLSFRVDGISKSYFVVPGCSGGECLDEVGSFVVKDGGVSSELAGKLGKEVCELNEKIRK